MTVSFVKQPARPRIGDVVIYRPFGGAGLRRAVVTNIDDVEREKGRLGFDGYINQPGQFMSVWGYDSQIEQIIRNAGGPSTIELDHAPFPIGAAPLVDYGRP